MIVEQFQGNYLKGGIYNFQKVGDWVQLLSRVALNARKQKFEYW